jgi:hypothetical protein
MLTRDGKEIPEFMKELAAIVDDAGSAAFQADGNAGEVMGTRINDRAIGE